MFDPIKAMKQAATMAKLKPLAGVLHHVGDLIDGIEAEDLSKMGSALTEMGQDVGTPLGLRSGALKAGAVLTAAGAALAAEAS